MGTGGDCPWCWCPLPLVRFAVVPWWMTMIIGATHTGGSPNVNCERYGNGMFWRNARDKMRCVGNMRNEIHPPIEDRLIGKLPYIMALVLDGCVRCLGCVRRTCAVLLYNNMRIHNWSIEGREICRRFENSNGNLACVDMRCRWVGGWMNDSWRRFGLKISFVLNNKIVLQAAEYSWKPWFNSSSFWLISSATLIDSWQNELHRYACSMKLKDNKIVQAFHVWEEEESQTKNK